MVHWPMFWKIYICQTNHFNIISFIKSRSKKPDDSIGLKNWKLSIWKPKIHGYWLIGQTWVHYALELASNPSWWMKNYWTGLRKMGQGSQMHLWVKFETWVNTDPCYLPTMFEELT